MVEKNSQQQSQQKGGQLLLDSVSPATRLLEKRRLMYEVQEAFERQKEEERRKEEEFKKKEEELRQKDLFIQKSLIDFNRFLQENEAKKARAEKRLEEENRQKSKKEKEIEEAKIQLETLQIESTKLEKQVSAMKKYEEYLEMVREKNPDEFSDINEILNRYKTLQDANTDLKKKQDKFEADIEAIRKQRDQYEKDKTNEILSLGNEIGILQKRLDELEIKRAKLQKNVEFNTEEATQKSLALGCILMAIDNLYQRCKDDGPKINHASEVQIEKITSEDYAAKGAEAQKKLKVIAAYLNDFKDITAQLKKIKQEQRLEQKKKEALPKTFYEN